MHSRAKKNMKHSNTTPGLNYLVKHHITACYLGGVHGQQSVIRPRHGNTHRRAIARRSGHAEIAGAIAAGDAQRLERGPIPAPLHAKQFNVVAGIAKHRDGLVGDHFGEFGLWEG